MVERKPKLITPKAKPEEEKHDDPVTTNTQKRFCTDCNEMIQNEFFKTPEYQCARCKFPIPKEQGLRGECPHCEYMKFEKYKPTIEGEVEGEVIEQ